MSPTHTKNRLLIIHELQSMIDELVAITQPTRRDWAMLEEFYMRYNEFMDELIEEEIKRLNTSVTVRVDGTTIKFHGIEEVAKWAIQ